MNICEKKNQIQDILNDIYSEYNRMNESKIQNKCETDLEMRTMIDNIRYLETNSIEKDNRIKSLEKTVFDYEQIIQKLNEKLEIKEEYDRENNRHDMLRTLSKDISEKDREINRLNGLLNFHKKEKKTKSIDNLIGNLNKKDNNIKLLEIIEPFNKKTGEVNPNFIYEEIDNTNEEIDNTNEEIDNTNEEIDNTNEEIDNTKEEIDNTKEETIQKTLLRVKSKGKYYFVYKEDNPQDVYEYNDEKNADKIIGKRTRLPNGKYKLELF